MSKFLKITQYLKKNQYFNFWPPVHFKTIWTPYMCGCIYMRVQYGPFQESYIYVYSHSDQVGHVRDTFGKL